MAYWVKHLSCTLLIVLTAESVALAGSIVRREHDKANTPATQPYSASKEHLNQWQPHDDNTYWRCMSILNEPSEGLFLACSLETQGREKARLYDTLRRSWNKDLATPTRLSVLEISSPPLPGSFEPEVELELIMFASGKRPTNWRDNEGIDSPETFLLWGGAVLIVAIIIEYRFEILTRKPK